MSDRVYIELFATVAILFFIGLSAAALFGAKILLKICMFVALARLAWFLEKEFRR